MANKDQKNRQGKTNKPKVSTKEKQKNKAMKLAAKRGNLYQLPR